MDETCRRILGDKLADQIGPAWSSDGDPVGVCGQTGHPKYASHNLVHKKRQRSADI